MKTKIERPYKMGDLIMITKRKCSDKIQPNIKVGTHYLVIEEGRLKNGAVALKVAEFSTMVQEGQRDPHAKIASKFIMHCNEDRFEWKRKSQKELLARFTEFKEELNKRQEEKEEAFLKEKFTEKERIQMAYHPYIYAELAWYYALQAMDLARSRRIESLKKVCRQLQELRNDFIYELRKRMSQPVLDCAQRKVLQLLRERKEDFFIFYTTMQNEINYQHLRVPDDDLKTFAYMSILCYRSQKNLDDVNVEIIRNKLGFATRHESFKYMSDLYEFMKQCMDGYKIENTVPIQTSVAIMEKNVMNLKL